MRRRVAEDAAGSLRGGGGAESEAAPLHLARVGGRGIPGSEKELRPGQVQIELRGGPADFEQRTFQRRETEHEVHA